MNCKKFVCCAHFTPNNYNCLNEFDLQNRSTFQFKNGHIHVTRGGVETFICPRKICIKRQIYYDKGVKNNLEIKNYSICFNLNCNTDKNYIQ